MINYYIQLIVITFFFGFGICSAVYLITCMSSPRLNEQVQKELKMAVINALMDYQNLEQFMKDSDPKKETKI